MIHGLDGCLYAVMKLHVTYHVTKYYVRRLMKVWAKIIAESFIIVPFAVIEILGEA